VFSLADPTANLAALALAVQKSANKTLKFKDETFAKNKKATVKQLNAINAVVLAE